MPSKLFMFVFGLVVCLTGVSHAQETFVSRGETGIFASFQSVEIDDKTADGYWFGVNVEGYVAVGMAFSDGGDYFSVDATHLTFNGFLAQIDPDKSSFALSFDAELVLPEDNFLIDNVVGIGGSGHYNLHLGPIFRFQPSGGFMMYLPKAEGNFDVDNVAYLYGGANAFVRLEAPLALGGGLEFGQYSQSGDSENVFRFDIGIVVFVDGLGN